MKTEAKGFLLACTLTLNRFACFLSVINSLALEQLTWSKQFINHFTLSLLLLLHTNILEMLRLHCANGLFQVWELFLQQVEVNSQQHGDISRNFNQTVGRGLVERVFHRKIQSKKIFAHRDRIETILLKSSELLLKVSLILHSFSLFLSLTLL